MYAYFLIYILINQIKNPTLLSGYFNYIKEKKSWKNIDKINTITIITIIVTKYFVPKAKLETTKRAKTMVIKIALFNPLSILWFVIITPITIKRVNINSRMACFFVIITSSGLVKLLIILN